MNGSQIKWFLISACLVVVACGDDFEAPEDHVPVEPSSCELPLSELPYATEVIQFTPGLNAGFGESDFPQVVLGPPGGKGNEQGSLNVLSLGVGGEIVLGFGNRNIVDGEGVDFVVFENPFAIGGNLEKPFAELAQVAVSMDGENWTSFPCSIDSEYPWPGCAGWQYVESFPTCSESMDSALTGGDLFDLGAVGLQEARYIRIVDLSESGSAPSAGFDLDAVGAFYLTNNTNN